MTPRSREELQTLLGINDPNKLNPVRLSSSDITPISCTNPSLNGQVRINTPDDNSSGTFINLPARSITTQLAQGCQACGTAAKSQFMITGRGGLPPNPGEALNTDAV